MRILLSNDDGIGSQGLNMLAAAARRLTQDVWVLAPEGNRSAVGHGITLRDTLRLTRLGDREYSCSGTPADCIIAAQTWLFAATQPPDLVLSGINAGINVAEDIAYSGTMAAAREAVFWGIPAISLSRPRDVGRYDERECAWLAGALRHLWACRAQWSGRGGWLNINLPASLPAPLREARIGRHKIGRSSQVVSAEGDEIRLQISNGRDGAYREGDECPLIDAGYASVTNVTWSASTPLPPGFCDAPAPQDMNEPIAIAPT